MRDNPNDKVYTPSNIVEDVLAYYGFQIGRQDLLLEPFRGGGAFYDKLKEYSDNEVLWCEIDEGEDFFDFNDKVDWVITNPPYSIFDKILPKLLEVADNNVVVIPVNKLLSSMPRLMDIKRAGHGIRDVYYLGSGRQLKFPFGFPVAAIHIQKGWKEAWYREHYHERCYKAKAK